MGFELLTELSSQRVGGILLCRDGKSGWDDGRTRSISMASLFAMLRLVRISTCPSAQAFRRDRNRSSCSKRSRSAALDSLLAPIRVLVCRFGSRVPNPTPRYPIAEAFEPARRMKKVMWDLRASPAAQRHGRRRPVKLRQADRIRQRPKAASGGLEEMVQSWHWPVTPRWLLPTQNVIPQAPADCRSSPLDDEADTAEVLVTTRH
ncbi:hypothetical protein VTK26DRAFT_8948 [Humicola hyalothermophila]